MAVARAVRLVVGIVVAIIVLAVILRLLDANSGNVIVSDIHDAGAWLVGPFDNLFSLKGPKLNMAVNWGLAALVYSVIGTFIASFAARGAAAAYTRGGGYRRPGFRRRGYGPSQRPLV